MLPEGSAASARGARLAMLAICAVVVAADQVSKTLVLAVRPAQGTPSGWIAVRLLRNTGANGGVAAGYPVLVTLVAATIACVAAVFALRVRGRGIALCMATVVGGALGNLADRLFRSPGFGRGGVVDWIHIGVVSGSFNVADLAIQIGVLGTVIGLLARGRPHKAGQPAQQVKTG